MIKLRVTTVTRKTSYTHRTVRYTYNNVGHCKSEPSQGAEWETIELMSIEEEQPPIQTANMTGSVVMGTPANITINDPTLFGTFKAGDIVELHVVQKS